MNNTLKQLQEKLCEECLLPQKICDDLQTIVYEECPKKRKELAQKLRKQYKEISIRL